VVTTNDDCAQGETESRWVQVSLYDDYTPMFPVHFSGISSNGKYRVQAVAGMRTE